MQSLYRDPETGMCFPFSVAKVEGVGRVLRAAKDLEPGELVFREKEFVVGPSKTTPPVCLGCGRRVSGKVLCPGCSWPVCSLSCSGLGTQHSAEECLVVAPSGPGIPPGEAPDSHGEAPACPDYQVTPSALHLSLHGLRCTCICKIF